MWKSFEKFALLASFSVKTWHNSIDQMETNLGAVSSWVQGFRVKCLKILVFHWWELTHRRNACVCWAVQSSQKWDHCVGIWKQLTVRLQRWRPFWVEQVRARLSLRRLLFSFSSWNLPSHRHCRHLMNNNAFPASPIKDTYQQSEACNSLHQIKVRMRSWPL